jgi:hypothetical protein
MPRSGDLPRLLLGAVLLAAGLLLIVASRQAQGASLPRPGASASPTPALNDDMSLCDDDEDDPVYCQGAFGQLADMLAADNSHAPTPSDADLGGLGATGLILLTAGGAAVASGAAGGFAGLSAAFSGSPGGAGQSGGAGHPGVPNAGGGQSYAVAAATQGHAGLGGTSTAALLGGVAGQAPVAVTAAVSQIPWPRAEMIAAGLSIYRSMKRVTSEADPSGYSAGDLAQMIGDATAIGTLASALAPAANLVALATAGAAAGAETHKPKEVLDRLRQSFGQLGYLQGVLDENLGRTDGKLAGLDGALGGTADAPALPAPAQLWMLPDDQLRNARSAWAARADMEFDALIAAQDELSEVDERRRSLGDQIDQINELLSRLDRDGMAVMAPHLGETLRYGQGWYRAADPDRMIAALRESQANSAGSPRRRTHGTGARSSRSPGFDSPPPGGLPFGQWAAANGFQGGRMGVLEALAGLERWSGFFDALSGTLQSGIATLRAGSDEASGARRALSAEIQRRTMQGAAR